MAMTIATNLASQNAQRILGTSQVGMNTAVQRLSSGLRINSAKDDAAGLAISERMLTQVRGMSVAARNANDGISLAQVAEGAMQKTTDILQRGRELAVQAANDTNSSTDRKALFAEYAQLHQELARIATDTNFNGKQLLDGSFGTQQFQVGANAAQTIAVSIPALREDSLGLYSSSNAKLSGYSLQDVSQPQVSEMQPSNFNAWAALVNSPNRQITFNGRTASVDGVLSAESYAAVLRPLTGSSGAEVSVSSSVTLAAAYEPAQQIAIRLVAGEDYGNARAISFRLDGSDTSVQEAMAAINRQSAATGVVAESGIPPNSIRLKNTEGKNIHVMNDGDDSSSISLLDRAWGPAYPEGIFSKFANIQGTAGGGVFGMDDGFSIGAISLVSSQSFSYQGDASYEYDNDGNELRSGLFDGGAREFYDLKDISFSSNKLANISLQIFDAAIAQVSKARAEIGAVQSRFEAAIGNLSIAGEKTAAARSRIADADFAVETAQLARQQILQNAGTAMVAQANSLPEQVLALIKSV